MIEGLETGAISGDLETWRSVSARGHKAGALRGSQRRPIRHCEPLLYGMAQNLKAQEGGVAICLKVLGLSP